MHTASLESPRWRAESTRVSYRVHLPLHRRIAVSQLTTLRWSLPEAIDGFRRGGIPAIGVSFNRLCERGIEAAIEEMQQSGLLVSSVGWIGGFTGAESGTWEEAVQQARLVLWTAGQLRAQSVTVITGPRLTHIRSHLQRIVSDALIELAPLAAEYGVRLALQPMHPVCRHEWTFLTSLDETLQILDRVNHPFVGMAFSPYHLSHETDLVERIPSIASRIACVQLSDWHRSPRDDNDRALPGDGILPLSEIVSALEQAGYRGLYEIDPWSRDLWKRNYDGLIAECRRRFERLSQGAPDLDVTAPLPCS